MSKQNFKIALFYRVWFDSGEKFLAAARKSGIELVPVHYDDLILKQKGTGFDIYYQGEPLSDFSLFYFRAVGEATEWANLLVAYAKSKQIPFVDEYLGIWGPARRLKSFSGIILAENRVAYPQTSLVSREDRLFEEVKNFSFPLILKVSKGGRHGIGTLLVKDEQMLARVIKGRIERSSFLLQEYLPNDGDYRLFLVGYQVLGGFKRQKKEEKLVLNRSAGTSANLEKIPSQIINLAQKAASVLKVEVAAIDLVINQKTGQPVIIEVNEAPEFYVFEKRTGINVAQKVVEFLITKAKTG